MAYSLQLTGKALAGFDLESAKSEFAKLFNVSDKIKLEKIFSTKNNITIRKSITQSDAIEYQRHLNKIGLESTILKPDGSIFSFSDSNKLTEHDSVDDIDLDISDMDVGNISDVSKCQTSSGINWVKEGFSFFRQNPVKWILTYLAWIVISLAINIIPIIGQVIAIILSMVMFPGLMYAAYQQDNGNEIKILETFMAIKKSLSLLVVYIIYLVVMTGATFLLIPNLSMSFPIFSIVSLMIFFVFWLLFSMAISFAGPLVVISHTPLLESIKLGFRGSMKNLIPLIVFGILASLLSILGILLLGIGSLVTSPIVIAGFYAAYRDIFLRA